VFGTHYATPRETVSRHPLAGVESGHGRWESYIRLPELQDSNSVRDGGQPASHSLSGMPEASLHPNESSAADIREADMPHLFDDIHGYRLLSEEMAG
jgi:hypothetical protein